MATRPPPDDKAKKPPQQGWSDLAPLPQPEAQERNSDSAWAEFEQLSNPVEFRPTQPASEVMPMPAVKGDPRYAKTVPSPLTRSKEPAPRAPTVRHITMDQAMTEARRNNRICPQAHEWQQLYQMLPGTKQTPHGAEPQAPLTGSAWGVTTGLAKRMCLRDQLEWAERKGCLDEVFAFLRALPEEGWYHAEG